MTPVQDDAAGARCQAADIDGLPLTRLHVLILCGCCVAFSFDLAEIAFGNILSTVFSAPPHSVSDRQLSWLLASVYIGAVFGAPSLGWIADRYGRRIAMVSAMALLALASWWAGAAANIDALIVSRIAAGIALGAYPPLMFSYLTDILPASRRGVCIVMATAIGYLGPTVFIFFVLALAPVAPLGLESWRWGFFTAGLGAALCTLGFWWLPESPRWLLSKGKLAEAAQIADAFRRSAVMTGFDRSRPKPPGQQKRANPVSSSLPIGQTVFFLLLYVLTPWAIVGFTLLSGTILVAKGMNVQESLLYVGISTFGPIIGTLGGGLFVDRFQRKSFLTVTATVMGVLGMVFAATGIPWLLVSSALLFNMVYSLFLPVLVLYTAEAIATPHRAKLTSLAWMANRGGSVLVPLLLLPVLKGYGPLAMFAIIALTLTLFVSLISMFGPTGRSGRPVE